MLFKVCVGGGGITESKSPLLLHYQLRILEALLPSELYFIELLEHFQRVVVVVVVIVIVVVIVVQSVTVVEAFLHFKWEKRRRHHH